MATCMKDNIIWCFPLGPPGAVPCPLRFPQLVGLVWRFLCKRGGRARSHCRFVLPFIYFIPESLTYSVPLFLKRQCDRTLRGGRSAALFGGVRLSGRRRTLTSARAPSRAACVRGRAATQRRATRRSTRCWQSSRLLFKVCKYSLEQFRTRFSCFKPL